MNRLVESRARRERDRCRLRRARGRHRRRPGREGRPGRQHRRRSQALALPGVTVTITEVNTNISYTAVTNESGNYVLREPEGRHLPRVRRS